MMFVMSNSKIECLVLKTGTPDFDYIFEVTPPVALDKHSELVLLSEFH
jgi:hypothetical protein